MALMVAVMLVVCIGVPLAYIWRVLKLDEPTLAAWLIVTADATVFVALVVIVGRWDMAGYYLRLAVPVVFAAAVLWSLRRHVRRPWRAPVAPVLRRRWQTLVSLVLFGGALGYVVSSGLLPPPQPRELVFPLAEGRFVVGQGGGIGLLNHHAGHPAQRHAADIGAINAFGYRAAGLLPRDLDRYAIYGTPVVSPCAGVVVGAADDLPDLVPPQRDPENARGNHVIIDCGGFNVELAHLQQGSVVVAAGDRLAAGDPLGRVGNSGNTTEPHLHVHAVDPETGQGVPVSFGGRSPVRNRLYIN